MPVQAICFKEGTSKNVECCFIFHTAGSIDAGKLDDCVEWVYIANCKTDDLVILIFRGKKINLTEC